MEQALSLTEIKARSLEFVDRLGNKHDTSSTQITALFSPDFAVQHGNMAPSTGGRDAFLSNLGRRLSFAHGQVSVDIKQVTAELHETGGQCWVYSRKNTPLGATNSLDMISFDVQGRITFCQDLHSPKEEVLSRFLQWLMTVLFRR